VARYACEDADYTGRLVQVLEKELEESGRRELFTDLEMPLVPVLTAMEMEGIAIDEERIGELSRDLGRRLAKMRKKVFEMAGREFNLNSTQQLAEVLFDDLEIHKIAGGKKPRKTRKTGRYSTSASVLEQLAPHHELPRIMLEYRELNKLKNTYVDVLPGLVHPGTGRIHTSFNQAVTATGRLSSSDPNLQNIPVRTEMGRRVRACFVPRAPGWKLLSLDYSQIELRVLAHLSRDESLLETFAEDRDIHRRTAALVLKKKEEEVTSLDRSRAKAINFGILYGMGPRRLAAGTGLTREEAARFIENYFAALGGVKRWLEESIARAREEGEVFTLFGRRRPLPEINSPHERIRVNAEHMAVNTPIQGTAADIMKKAMIEVDELIREKGYQARPVLQVHDELLIDCPAGEVEEVRREATRVMEGTLELAVPLKVEAGQGDDWLEAH